MSRTDSPDILIWKSTVENIDKQFINSRWPESNTGNLYKEVWLNTASPYAYTNALETNNKAGDNPDVSRMVDAFSAIANSTESDFVKNISPYIDLDYMTRFLAVNKAIKNWDGVTTWVQLNSSIITNHNYPKKLS